MSGVFKIKESKNGENSFKYDRESRDNVNSCFKFVNFTDKVKLKSKIKTNGNQPETHVKEE